MLKGPLHFRIFLNPSSIKSSKISDNTFWKSFRIDTFFLTFCHCQRIYDLIFVSSITNLSFVHLARSSGINRFSNILSFFIFGDRFLALRYPSRLFLTFKNAFSLSFDALVNQIFSNIYIIVAFSIFLFGLDLCLFIPILLLRSILLLSSFLSLYSL